MGTKAAAYPKCIIHRRLSPWPHALIFPGLEIRCPSSLRSDISQLPRDPPPLCTCPSLMCSGFFYSFLSWSLFITSLNRSRYSQSEKAYLDPSASSSCHPISQLPFPAKFLEFMPSKFCCVFLHLPSSTP